MNPTLVIVDDALDKDVAEALHLKLTTEAVFKDEVSPGDGATYPNICKDFVPEAELARCLAKIHNADVDIKLACFRLGLVGEKDDTFCHADGVYAERAAVLYLTKGRDGAGGTAFHRHSSGITTCPSPKQIAAAGFDFDQYHRWLTKQTQFEHRNEWTLAGFAELKFNRLISYPTNVFHSRYPNHIEAPLFGDTPESGRLILVAFYDVKQPSDQQNATA